MDNVTVLDRKPVGGDETALQSYIDLTLSKDDIVEAILTQESMETDKEVEDLTDRLTQIDRRNSEIRNESRPWIIERLEKTFGKDRLDGIRTFLGSQGSYSFGSNHSYPWVCECYFKIDKDNSEFKFAHKESNIMDIPWFEEWKLLTEERREIQQKLSTARRKLERIKNQTKTMKLHMATTIMRQTEQGQALLKAMTIHKLSNAMNKELPPPPQKPNARKVVPSKKGKK